MKVWLIQSVVSPYRIKLFQQIAETPDVQFELILLSSKFKTRPQWKRDLSTLPFRSTVPFGISFQTGPEQQYCVNPLFLLKLLWERPDVVICGGYSFASLMVWLASWFSPIRYVIWTEATLHTDGGMTGLRLWLRRLLVRRAGAIVEAGTQAREYVRFLQPDFPDERLFRAFNCVDNQHFALVERKDRTLFDQKGFPEKNLIFVGKLNERKGIPQLLEVYRRLVQRCQPMPGLILIGEGELRSDVERLKTEQQLMHLRLEGWVQNEETARYYALSDAFMLLSKTDHNPLVLFEALAAGIPIICSKGACNAVDFIENGRNGYIVDPQDTEEVVSRTSEVLGWDAERRRSCEEFSRESVRKANYPDAARSFIQACQRAAQPRIPLAPVKHSAENLSS